MKSLQRGIGDASGWAEWLRKTVSELKSQEMFENGDLMEKYSDQFTEMAADVAEAVKDGLDIGDIVLLAELIPDIMKIAKNIEGAPQEQQEQFVVDAVWLIYHSVDTGPDGKQNRIKVPGAHWLSKLGMTSTEEKIERFVLKVGTEFALKVL